jgi:hypothetical protein
MGGLRRIKNEGWLRIWVAKEGCGWLPSPMSFVCFLHLSTCKYGERRSGNTAEYKNKSGENLGIIVAQSASAG